MERAFDIVPDDSDPGGGSSPGLASWYAPGLSDALGDRLLMFDNTAAASLELLRFKKEFGHSKPFEDALRTRIKTLEVFQHPAVATVRSLDWLRAGEELALISNHTAGRRLSEVLHDAKGATFAAELIRQLTPVIASLHHYAPGICHGALTLERIVVTPEGRLVILEHVLGRALQVLDLPAQRLQTEFGLVPPRGGSSKDLNQRSDVLQLGLVAAGVLLGRPISPIEYATKGVELLDDYAWTDSGGRAAFPQLKTWLERALRDDEDAFDSAEDANRDLDALAEPAEPVRSRPSLILATAPAARLDSSVETDNEPKVPGFLSEEELTEHPGRSSAFDTAMMAADPADIEPLPASRPPNMWPPLDDGPVLTTASSKAPSPSGPSPRAAYVPLFAESAPTLAPPTSSLPPTPTPTAAPVRARAGSSMRTTGLAMWVAAAFGIVAVLEGGILSGLIPPPTQWGHRTPAGTRAGSGGQVVPPQTGRSSIAGPGVLPSTSTSGTSADGRAGGTTGAAAPATPAGGSTGQLDVTSDPAGARVTIDGIARGATPTSVALAPGAHAVIVSDGTSTSRRTVTMASGATSTFAASFAPAGVAAGWLTIKSSLDLQVREAGSLLGVTSADRLMLPAGHHDLQLSSALVAFQTGLTVDVPSGKTVNTTVTIPNGVLSINALPWANVRIDGQLLSGTTPFATVEVPLGSHEVVWTHPQLGEKRQTVLVTAAAIKTPLRLVMDLRK